MSEKSEPIQYPSVVDPTQDPQSLQQAIQQIKEGYELLTGQRGPPQYSVQEGLGELKKVYVGLGETLMARIVDLNEVVVDANRAFAQRITIIEAEIVSARGDFPSLAARITSVSTASADANEAMAQRVTTIEAEITNARGGLGDLSSRITQVDQARVSGDQALANSVTNLQVQRDTDVSNINASITNEQTARINGDSANAASISNLTTTVNGNTATINTHTNSINGLSVSFGVQGYINGATGGFVFTGIRRNDGAVVYNFEISANTTIYGNLLVNGTITETKIGDEEVSTQKVKSGAITGVSTVNQSTSISKTPQHHNNQIYCRAGGAVLIIISTYGHSNSTNAFNVYVEGAYIGSFSAPVARYVTQSASDNGQDSVSYYAGPITMQYRVSVGAANKVMNLQVQSSDLFTVGCVSTMFELAK